MKKRFTLLLAQAFCLYGFISAQCTGVDSISSASNLFTMILTENSSIAVDNALNTMIFIHRNNATALGGHSGQLRYDISTNGGASWTSNQGVLNPLSVNGTNAARYPNVAIYNPTGNTDPNNAYLVHYEATVAATFNGTVSGVRRLNGTGNTETYNQPTATQTLIPRSLVKGAPGVFWAIDAVYTGTNTTGFRILKGTWNGTNDVVWAVNNTISPTFNTAYDGLEKVSDFNIAFDPSGNNGWVCILSHLSGGPANYAFYPVFYRTVDGGTTWTGPIQVDVGQFPCIANNIDVGSVATTAFDMDLTVDVNGNPHCIVPVGNGSNAYGIFFTSWHAMADITLDHGVWNAMILSPVFRGRGLWGTTPNQVSLDMESQASRTDDGTKVFFAWADADSSNPNANQQPNLYGMAYDVNTRRLTARKNFTGCHPIFNGRALFPKLAPTVRNANGGWQLPVVVGRLLGAAQDPIAVSSFHFVDSAYFYPANFSTPICTTTVNLAPNDTLISCGPATLNGGTAQLYAWSTGATTQTISAATSGWYSVAVSNNCCVGWDSVYVSVQPVPSASFTANANALVLSFTDASAGLPTQWSWNFGDGNISTVQNPTHTYAAPGTYNVCLTITNACSTSTSCQNITVTCPPAVPSFTVNTTGLSATFTNTTGGSPTTYSWAFGDGNFSSFQHPTHTFGANGTYTVCLAITDLCGSDTTCQLVTVGCTTATAAFSAAAAGGLTMAFNDQTVGNPFAWAWDFGDGNTSTQQFTAHTYAAAGVYTVCLTITDSCGTDSSCQTLVVCESPVAAFTQTLGTSGTITFQDLSSGTPNSWLWDFGDGSTSTLQNPTHTFPVSGTYTICLTVTNSCATDSVCLTQFVNVVGIADGLGMEVQVVPNPAEEDVRVMVTELSAGAVRVRLVNVVGQEVLVREIAHGGGAFSALVPLEGVDAGLYFVELSHEGRKATRKLIVR